MPDPDLIERLRRRLRRWGCLPGYVERVVTELADHRDQLRREGLAAGLSEPDADTQADARLGDPEVLADQLVTRLRASSWWGRHRVLGFCLFPPVAAVAAGLGVFVLAGALAATLADGLGVSRPAGSAGPALLVGAGAVGVALSALVLVPMLFCWLARRHGCGRRWAWLACGLIALPASMLVISAPGGNVVMAVGLAAWSPNWLAAALPLLVGLLAAVEPRPGQG